jgi:2-phospho-L-lactate/phosphoenolpyruvate guanylyltransferase
MRTAPQALQLIFAARGGSAKSRCAALLNADQRDQLTAALLRDVLTAAGPHCKWLVTPTLSLTTIGREAGAAIIPEPKDAGGLNGAYAHALAHVDARAPSAARALLPSDLGFLELSEINQAQAALRRHDIVLAPTRHGGTGAVFLAPHVSFAPAFGPDSFARHHAAARAAGLRIFVLDTPGFSRDVDVPEDVLSLAAERPHSCAGALAARLLAAPRSAVLS